MYRFKRPWLPVYEGENTDEPVVAPVVEPEVGVEPTVVKKGKVTFTKEQQEHMNGLIAKTKKEQQSHTQKALDELKLIGDRADMTDAERTDLAERLENAEASLKTRAELARTELDKAKQTAAEEKEALEVEAKTWQRRFKTSTVQRAITDAATAKGQESFSPSQIVAIVGPMTRLTETKGEDDEPIYEVKTKLPTVNDKGEALDLDLPVLEAVRKMSEMPEYANLFKAATASGLGLNTAGKTSNITMKELVKDPAKYREIARKEGLMP